MKLPVSQFSPVYPTTQVQVYESTWSSSISIKQVPPFLQGLEVHASMPAWRLSVLLIVTLKSRCYDDYKSKHGKEMKLIPLR